MFRICFFFVIPTVIGIIVTDPLPQPTDYKYAYSIDDPTTGDSKSQHEVRQGDVVSGAYSVVGPDGTKRIVEYTADSKNGFKAVVREEPADAALTTPTVTNNQGYYPLHYQKRLYGRPVYAPVSAPANELKPSTYYRDTKSRYEGEGQTVYFMPANEIQSESRSFEHGQYFLPANL